MTQNFYTFVGKYGNKILWRGYENGKPFTREVAYKPTLFIPTKDTDSEYKSLITKRPLQPKTFDRMSDANDFIEQYKDVNGFDIHGNSNFVATFIHDNYPDNIDFDESLINLFSYDIETNISDGYPNMETCDKPITSIALKYRKKKEYVLLGQKNYDRHKTLTDIDPENIVYEQFDNEKALLRRFVEIWTSDYPEVVTGWNCIPVNSMIWADDRIKPFHSIHEGESLFDSNVVKTSPVSMKRENLITLSNGAKTSASEDHIFPVVSVERGKYISPNRNRPYEAVEMTVSEMNAKIDTHNLYIYQPLRNNTKDDISWFDLFYENKVLMEKKGVKYKSFSTDYVEVYFDLGENSPDQSRTKMRNFSTYKFYKNDSAITKEELWLAGVFYADGSSSVDSKTMSFYNNEPNIVERVSDVANRKYRCDDIHKKGNNTTWKFRKNNHSARVRFSLSRGWLIKIFSYDTVFGKSTKNLDLELMSLLSYNQVVSFISGAIDGDGHVNKSGPALSIFNGDTQKFRQLCSWNGIFTRVYGNDTRISFICDDFELVHHKKREDLQETTCKMIRQSKSNNLRWFPTGDGMYVRVSSIELGDMVEMMDMETDTNLFVSDGIRTHNCQYFDIWYTFTRIKHHFGENTLKRMSPWGIIKKSSKEIYNKVQSTYDIMGVSIVDYMDAFKKFGYKYGTQESYKLDHIASVVLGETKLSYERFGNKIDTHRFISDGAKGIKIPDDVPDEELDEKEMLVRRRDILKQKHEENPDDKKIKEMLIKYTILADDAYHQFGLDYNLKDTRIIEMLEDETALLSLVFAVAYRGGSNFKDAFGTVGIWDTTLYRKIRAEGMVPPIKRGGKSELGELEGGFVKDPHVGIHDWVVSFDLDSLYPHLMMGSNLSPETLVGKKYLEEIAKSGD